jgi:hypothetical protein
VRVRVVLGVALALVGVALVVTLSQRGQRLAGTSFVAQRTFPVVIPPHARACQRSTFLADDSATAQLLVGTYGRPRPTLSVVFADPDGVVVARGRVPGSLLEGIVDVPLERVVDGDHLATTVCVRNEGSNRAALAGEIASPDAAAAVDGRPTAGIAGFRYLRAASESWWSLAPLIAQRFGWGKASLVGTWTLPLLALVVAGLWFASIRLLLREDP